MIMEEMRKQFEKEYAKHYQSPCQFDRHDKSGDYVDVRTRAGWRMWQASRAALVVELPKDVASVTNKPYEEGRDDVIAAIEKAGITVKGE